MLIEQYGIYKFKISVVCRSSKGQNVILVTGLGFILQAASICWADRLFSKIWIAFMHSCIYSVFLFDLHWMVSCSRHSGELKFGHIVPLLYYTTQHRTTKDIKTGMQMALQPHISIRLLCDKCSALHICPRLCHMGLWHRSLAPEADRSASGRTCVCVSAVCPSWLHLRRLWRRVSVLKQWEARMNSWNSFHLDGDC